MVLERMSAEVLSEKKENSKRLLACGWFQLNILRIVTTKLRSGVDIRLYYIDFTCCQSLKPFNTPPPLHPNAIFTSFAFAFFFLLLFLSGGKKAS